MSCQVLKVLVCLLSTSLLAAEIYTSNNELSHIMQSLWNADGNRLAVGREVVLNLQRKASTYNDIDQAPSSLFRAVTEISNKSTYKKFMALLDNYNAHTHLNDQASSEERSEQQTFINSILGTPVWQACQRFLISKGFMDKHQEITSELHRIWFTEYSRSRGIKGSSGFEHVFAGELSSEKKEISGLHNWLKVYSEEKTGKLNYMGYVNALPQINLYQIKVRQGDYRKFANSMFIGTSPEFEMAVYTICFFSRPNKECRFTMNGNLVTIQTYANYDKSLATAYPKL